MRAALFIIGLVAALSVQAEIYKYVDESGQVTYSNLPRRGAVKLNLEPPAKPAASNPAGGGMHKKDVSSPVSFPKVDGGTQRKRDDMRRTVLQEELRTEERNLAEARAALKEGEALRAGEKPGSPSWLGRVEKLRDGVKLHEDNIAALRKELGSVK